MIQDNAVPKVYQDRLRFEIKKFGFKKCKQILLNHSLGGVRYSKDEYMRCQDRDINL